MSFLDYSGLDPKSKIKHVLRLLSGHPKKSIELERLIRAQVRDDSQYQFSEVLPKDFPKDIYTAVWVLKQLGFSNYAITQLKSQIPTDPRSISSLYEKACKQFKK